MESSRIGWWIYGFKPLESWKRKNIDLIRALAIGAKIVIDDPSIHKSLYSTQASVPVPELAIKLIMMLKGGSLHFKVPAFNSALDSHNAEIRPWFWNVPRGQLRIPFLRNLVIYGDVVKANDGVWIAFT